MKFCELERYTFQRGSYRGRRREITNDVKVLASNNERLNAISDRVVLHQYFILVEKSLHLIHCWNFQILKRRPARLLRSNFSEQLDQLLLTTGNLFFCRGIGSIYSRGCTHFIQPSVKNVQFFSNLSNSLQSGRLFRASFPSSLEVLFEQID